MLDLTAPPNWDTLGAAWRVAVNNRDAASEAHTAAEHDAEKLQTGAPGDAATREDMLARYEHNERAAALAGVPLAAERMNAAIDAEAELVHAALEAPAPTLAAFLLKLDMVSDSWGWNDFDTDTWALFVADVRRFIQSEAAQ